MMKHEFLEAVREVSIGFTPTIGGTTWRIVHAFYQSGRLDSVCVGPDRHLRFARWILDNEARVSRVVARIGRSESKYRESLEVQISSLRWKLDAIGTCALR